METSKSNDSIKSEQNIPATQKESSAVLQKDDADSLLVKLRDGTFGHGQTPSIHDIITGMASDDDILQYYATQVCSKLVGRALGPPIGLICKEMISHCIEFLSSHHNSIIQYEALKILIKLSAGPSDQTMMVVNNGAIPKLMELLKSSSTRLAEQAVIALRNIASDEVCEQALKENCLPVLLELIKPDTSLSFMRNIAWTSAHWCRFDKRSHPIGTLKTILPVFSHMLTADDPQIIFNACKILKILIPGEQSEIQALVDSGTVPHIVALLASSHIQILRKAIHIVITISMGDDPQTDSIINAGGLEKLKELLKHEDLLIVADATLALSNITAGNHEQSQHVIDAGIVPSLFKILEKDNARVQKEAAWTITNVVNKGSLSQLRQIIEQGLLPSFCRLLGPNSEEVQKQLTDCLMSVLNDAEHDRAQRGTPALNGEKDP